MKDNIISFNNREEDPLLKMMKSMISALKEPVKEAVQEIEDQEVKDICIKYIDVCENFKKVLNKANEEEPKKCILCFSTFEINLGEEIHKAMRDYNKNIGGGNFLSYVYKKIG